MKVSDNQLQQVLKQAVKSLNGSYIYTPDANLVMEICYELVELRRINEASRNTCEYFMLDRKR